MMRRKLNWKIPHLHDHEDESHDHKATWLELFFDIVFVSIIAQISHIIATDLSWSSIIAYLLLFPPTWWAWITLTYYNDRFDSDDLSHRLLTFLAMIIAALMAYNVHLAFVGSYDGFVLSYIAYRILLISMWARGGYHNPVARPMTNIFLGGVLISVPLMFASVMLHGTLGIVLLVLGLLIEFITPLFTLDMQEKLPALSRDHLPERFGLFMIIVLGESIFAFVQGLSSVENLTTGNFITGALAMILTFSIWWIYFDHINTRTVKKGMRWTAGWTYAHLPLIMGVTALGASIIHLVPMSSEAIPFALASLTCLSAAIALLMMGVLEITLENNEQTCCKTLKGRICRFGGAGLMAAFSFIPWPNATILLSCLLAVMIFQIYIGFEYHPHLEKAIGEA